MGSRRASKEQRHEDRRPVNKFSKENGHEQEEEW
jgi:hypothetical protein